MKKRKQFTIFRPNWSFTGFLSDYTCSNMFRGLLSLIDKVSLLIASVDVAFSLITRFLSHSHRIRLCQTITMTCW